VTAEGKHLVNKRTVFVCDTNAAMYLSKLGKLQTLLKKLYRNTAINYVK
jgi:hypothetical protein